jgi:hypothetical protein
MNNRRDFVFWIAASVIILSAVVAASFPRYHPSAFLFWALLVGGLIVFRVGAQVVWASMRSEKRQQVWLGSGVCLVGLALAAVSLYRG